MAIDNIFLNTVIPKEFQIEIPINLTTYLIDGKLNKWSGETTNVYSAVCMNVNDQLERKLIGSIPRMSSFNA